ncbi:MAG: chemotaxis protein CheW [Acidobacteriota bacterium]
MNAREGSVSAGPLLEVRAAGRTWGLPLDAIGEVRRFDGSSVDSGDGQPKVHLGEGRGELPLASLDRWGTEGDDTSRGEHRLIVLHSGEHSFGLRVDEILGQRAAVEPRSPLPDLPFSERPPMAGFSGIGDGALPVLDVESLWKSVSDGGLDPQPSTPVPDGPPEGDIGGGDGDSDAGPVGALMALPDLGGSGDVPLTPVLSAAQVLGMTGAESVIDLPSLPPWCLGVGWWRGEAVAVFDLRCRLLGRTSESPKGRWLVAAVPGGGTVALALDGSCTAMPLPEAASPTEVAEPASSAVHGVFEAEGRRLALLDLRLWSLPVPWVEPEEPEEPAEADSPEVAFTEPPVGVLETPLPLPSWATPSAGAEAEVPVEPQDAAEAPFEPPSTAEVPVEPPDATEASFEPPSTAEVPFEPPSAAEEPAGSTDATQAPFEPPSTAEVPFEPPSTVETPLEPPSAAEMPFEPPSGEVEVLSVGAPEPVPGEPAGEGVATPETAEARDAGERVFELDSELPRPSWLESLDSLLDPKPD